jgi:hypothetical protein
MAGGYGGNFEFDIPGGFMYDKRGAARRGHMKLL